MEYKDILAISGYTGLFKFIAQGKNGMIVESFSDKKRMHVSASHKVSSMEDIAVFTSEGEAKLTDVFRNIHEMENGNETIDPKSDKKKIFEYFGKVVPEFDRSRVYHSDIKKILSWYNELLKNDLLTFKEEAPQEEEKEKTGEIREKPGTKTARERAKKTTQAGSLRPGTPTVKGKRIPGTTKNK